MRITIEIAPGEAIDKLTILAIKEVRLHDADKLAHVRREAALLRAALGRVLDTNPAVVTAMAELQAVNEQLWDVEDALREHEKRGDFGTAFIALARSVYVTNDRRAALKAAISTLLGSDIAEQKGYAA